MSNPINTNSSSVGRSQTTERTASSAWGQGMGSAFARLERALSLTTGDTPAARVASFGGQSRSAGPGISEFWGARPSSSNQSGGVLAKGVRAGIRAGGEAARLAN